MSAVKRTLMKLVDFLKNHQITSMFSSLNPSGGPHEGSAVAISSLIDAWILLRDLESDKERVRGLYVLKARGMAHSNQVREFLLSNKGVTLCDVYVGASGSVVTGTARVRGIAEDLALAGRLHDESEMRQIGLEKKRAELETDIAAMRAAHAAEAAAVWASFGGTVTKPRQPENQSSNPRSGRTVKTKAPPAKGAR